MAAGRSGSRRGHPDDVAPVAASADTAAGAAPQVAAGLLHEGGEPRHPLGDAEIHFLWWFGQGAIMDSDVRRRLRRAWGMCARHAAGYLTVEASLRHGYLQGPAILYEDLMRRAWKALAVAGPIGRIRTVARLRRAGPCLLCDMGYERVRDAPPSAADVVAEGRDISYLRDFARASRRYWLPTLCGRCSGDGEAARCREHLVEDLEMGRSSGLIAQRALAGDITRHVIAFARSFRQEHRGTATEEDRAALISAAGWCSGWDDLLDLCS